MDLIPNKGKEGPKQISSKYWKEFPSFEYSFLNITQVIQNELISIFALLTWSILAVFGMIRFSINLNAI